MENYKSSHTEASAGDDIIDLVQDIENLTKDDAIARLLELEERHEKTFFEIGGVLSALAEARAGALATSHCGAVCAILGTVW